MFKRQKSEPSDQSLNINYGNLKSKESMEYRAMENKSRGKTAEKNYRIKDNLGLPNNQF